MNLNPKIKDWLKKNEDSTMLGLAWACYWRLTATIYALILGVYLVVAILTIAFSK